MGPPRMRRLGSEQDGPVQHPSWDHGVDMAFSHTSVDQYGPVWQPEWELITCAALCPPSMDQYSTTPRISSPMWPFVLPVWTSAASCPGSLHPRGLAFSQYGPVGPPNWDFNAHVGSPSMDHCNPVPVPLLWVPSPPPPYLLPPPSPAGGTQASGDL